MPRGTNGRKIRYAVVGLGHIAQVAVLPAFRHAGNSELSAIVSGDARKRKKLSQKYKVPIAVDYSDYDSLLRSGAVDAVYIALPNDMHRQFTVKAAEAGIHVLCEKPLAVTSADCRSMIEAARKGSVHLMTAYRLHFDPAHLEAIRLLRSDELGDPRIFNSTFAFQVKDRNIRVLAERGGGPLYDIGIYCINAARCLFGDEPVEVMALSENNGEKRFREIDEAVSAVLRFPGARLASFVVSFGAADAGRLEVLGSKGRLELDPAYEYAEGLAQSSERSGRTKTLRYAKHDQFAAELVYFSRCIQADKEPEPSGWEGLADVRVIEAIERSLKTGKPVALPKFHRTRYPRSSQKIVRPPVRKPQEIRASSPHPN